MIRSTVFYATSSDFKKNELSSLLKTIKFKTKFGSQKFISDVCEFKITDVRTEEPLEIDLERMVFHKAKSAYRALLMPCIVEHAGLLIDGQFPGGLTQPMWDSLEAKGFIARTAAAGQNATARSVIGFCDGKTVRTFQGETKGKIANAPKGGREFYWDTIFCPDRGGGLTYAEIYETRGLEAKLKLSQMTKAFQELAAFLDEHGTGSLFE